MLPKICSNRILSAAKASIIKTKWKSLLLCTQGFESDSGTFWRHELTGILSIHIQGIEGTPTSIGDWTPPEITIPAEKMSGPLAVGARRTATVSCIFVETALSLACIR